MHTGMGLFDHSPCAQQSNTCRRLDGTLAIVDRGGLAMVAAAVAVAPARRRMAAARRVQKLGCLLFSLLFFLVGRREGRVFYRKHDGGRCPVCQKK